MNIMTDLTQEEIDQLVKDSVGKLNDTFCRLLVAYIAGYLRMSLDTEAAKQVKQIFFKQIKHALETNAKTPTFL
jgi:hypothetical protein